LVVNLVRPENTAATPEAAQSAVLRAPAHHAGDGSAVKRGSTLSHVSKARRGAPRKVLMRRPVEEQMQVLRLVPARRDSLKMTDHYDANCGKAHSGGTVLIPRARGSASCAQLAMPARSH
jgi:hypothetical protein